MVEVVKLDNKITIVMEKILCVRSISFGIFVKNGSRNESSQTNGISHFIEHLMFKGTKNRTAKQIANDMDSIGGYINAYTTKEYTCYYTKTLDNHFDVALDILADMYFNSKFDNDDIKKERNVIIEEINMYEDSPEEIGYDLLQEAVWRNNPLSFPILGTKESISDFDNETIDKYYKEHYRTDNTVLVVVGNFEKEKIILEIEKYFGEFTSLNKDIILKNSFYDKPEYIKSNLEKEKDIEQIHLTICFPGVKSGSDESYALAAVNTVFGGGMSSRLFQRIREENGLAYTVYSFASGFSDCGLFGIYAALNPSQFNQVYELILDEISLIKKEKITKEELSKTKEQLKSNFIMGLENTSSRASNIGRSMLILNKVNEADDIIEKVNAVNTENVSDIIEKVFDLENMSTSIVGRNIEKLI